MNYCKMAFWENSGVSHEVKVKTALSGGKGGQHINKTHTKVELYWHPAQSFVLDETMRSKVLTHLAHQLSKDGYLRIVCEEERSQLQNKTKAFRKLYTLLAGCFVEQKKRKPSKPSLNSIYKRLESKNHRKLLKQSRRNNYD
jgi:ribosome-associated protein